MTFCYRYNVLYVFVSNKTFRPTSIFLVVHGYFPFGILLYALRTSSQLFDPTFSLSTQKPTEVAMQPRKRNYTVGGGGNAYNAFLCLLLWARLCLSVESTLNVTRIWLKKLNGRVKLISLHCQNRMRVAAKQDGARSIGLFLLMIDR